MHETSPAKPKTCENCICWRHIGTSPVARNIFYDTGAVPIPPGPEGQCRLGAPMEDFKWPLTKGGDWCAQHRAAVPATGTDALARVVQEIEAEAKARPDATAELPLADAHNNSRSGENGAASSVEPADNQGGGRRHDDTVNRRAARGARRA